MPDPVPELVSRNMVIPSLESSELGSTIKDAFVLLDLSSPQHADHLDFGTKHVWVHEQVLLISKRFSMISKVELLNVNFKVQR